MATTILAQVLCEFARVSKCHKKICLEGCKDSIIFHFSVDLYNFEMEEEEDEDEDAIIERRRLQRLAILQKYQGGGTASNAPSTVNSNVSQSPRDERSDSEDSDAVEKLATEDLEKEIALASSQTEKQLAGARKGNDSDGNFQGDHTENEKKSVTGDMFADDDMFSENYSVSGIFFGLF